MKKSLSVFLCAVLTFGCVSLVSAQQQTINSWAFDTLTPGKVSRDNISSVLGMTVNKYVENVTEVEVVEEAGRGNVLSLSTKAANTTDRLVLYLPAPYTMSEDKLIVEYDFKIKSYVEAWQWFTSDTGNIGGALSTSDSKTTPFRVYCNNGTTNTTAVVFAPSTDVWYHVKQIEDYKNKVTKMIVTSGDGMTTLATQTQNFQTTATATNVNYKILGLQNYEPLNVLQNNFGMIHVDNINIYKQSNFKFVSSNVENNATDVPINKNISMTFNNNIKSSTLSNVVVKANGNTVSSSLYTITSNNNILNVSFPGDMEYGTVYTVDCTLLNDEYTQTVDGTNTLTFTTKPVPDVIIQDFELTAGIGQGQGVDNLKNLVITVKNNVSADKPIQGICAIYKNGMFYDYTMIQGISKAGEECKIGNLLVIPDELIGGKIKLFIWDDHLKPWQGNLEMEIQ